MVEYLVCLFYVKRMVIPFPGKRELHTHIFFFFLTFPEHREVGTQPRKRAQAWHRETVYRAYPASTASTAPTSAGVVERQ